jgi:RNA polymerase sigma-70 factor, ECF subfamily
MARVQADDTDAFGILFDRHHGVALGVARAVCRDQGRSEDAVQEGFLTMWRSRASFRSARGSFKGWAMTIVRHRAIDAVRAAGARPEATTERHAPIEAPGSVEQDAMAGADAEGLRAALGELPAAQAEVIVLAFYGQLSHSEIADQLDLPPGTVKGRMRLGLEKLRLTADAPGASE